MRWHVPSLCSEKGLDAPQQAWYLLAEASWLAHRFQKSFIHSEKIQLIMLLICPRFQYLHFKGERSLFPMFCSQSLASLHQHAQPLLFLLFIFHLRMPP